MRTRWGFLGAGWIASKALAPAVHASGNGLLQAVASRNPERSAALEPVRVHASYQDLLDDPEIDAVYISLTNEIHAEWSIRALQAGKHVLCEKPFALNFEQAQSMNDAAVANNRLLVEAVWTRWHPRFRRLVELSASGAIGELRSIKSSFTFPATIDGNYRLDPLKGGGSLFDTGPYQLHALVALSGSTSLMTIDEIKVNVGPSGVDLTTHVTGTLNDTLNFSLHSSFEERENQELLITGETSTIECLGSDAYTSWKAPSKLKIGQYEEIFSEVDSYQVMIENFGAAIESQSNWLVPIEDSLHVMRLLDQLHS